jgi:two-component system nitrate/nitrite sensor histidine kinase NarX
MAEPINIIRAPESARAEQGSNEIPALRALAEITTSLSSDADVEDLLARFLGTLVRLAGAIAGAVRVTTPDGLHLRLIGSVGLPPEVVKRERYVPANCGACGRAVAEQVTSSCAPEQVCGETLALGYFGARCRRVIAVPLRHRGKVLGVYNLFMGSERPVPGELALLFDSISEHLGIALENARLMRENIRATLVNERQMLANEVHDSLAQTLAYIKMRLALLNDAIHAGDGPLSEKYLGDVDQAMETAYGRLRDLLTHFRDRMDPRGLVPALRDLAEGIRARAGVEVAFESRAPEPELGPEQELHVYNVVQEALTNAWKHARARSIAVTIDLEGEEYCSAVRDDGAGIASGGDPRLSMKFGLNIMGERAQRLGGSLAIASHPGAGTTVTLRFPAHQAPR